jgi:hypothetical protein
MQRCQELFQSLEQFRSGVCFAPPVEAKTAFAHNLYWCTEGWPFHIQATNTEKIIEIAAALRIEVVQDGSFRQE